MRNLLLRACRILGMLGLLGMWCSSNSGLPRNWFGTHFFAIAADAAVERDFIRFSQFGAPTEIILNVATGSDCFNFWAVFVLGAQSDGINPLAEAVTLSVGSSKWVIPPGIFRVDHLGSYKAQTTVGRTLFDVMIQSRRRNEFEFRASAARAGLVDITNLVPVGLAIGDDRGEATVRAEIWSCSPRLKDD